MRIQKLLPLGARSAVALERSLHEWFSTPVGQQVLAAEAEVLRAVVPRLFGYYCVHAGPVTLPDVFSECTIKRYFRLVTGTQVLAPVTPSVSPPSESPASIMNAKLGSTKSCGSAPSVCVGKLDAMPFESNAVDAIILHHCLDTEMNPHSVLREACRVLMPGGTIIVAGFNPWSLWGLWRAMTFRSGFSRSSAPWGCRFVSPYRLSDWLNLLDFEVEGYETRARWPTAGAIPDVQSARRQFISDHYLRHFGTAYIMVAKKREPCMTLLKPVRSHAAGAFHPVAVAHAREPTAVGTVSSLVEARRKREDDLT